MVALYIFVSVIQSIAISLGVGSSTLAILNFFHAIKDGKIDATERSMMGLVYVVLRVAMVLISLTALVQIFILTSRYEFSYITPMLLASWTFIVILFVNAFGMTRGVVSSSFGPGIQAATWYSLGIIASLASFNLTYFSYTTLIVGYFLVVSLALIVVNGIIMHTHIQSPSSKKK